MKIIDLHLDTIDSTNSYAKQNCSTFAPDKITCITAEEQTAGRGRYNRTWVSPKGVNLYTTFYLQIPRSVQIVNLAQLTALSLATVLKEEGLHPKIKWPNDILLNEKKLSGILCETIIHPDFIELFIGIGLNVNMDAETAKKIDQPATSLQIETGHSWDKMALLKKLQKQFIYDLEIFKKQGFAPFSEQFEQLFASKGQTITVFDGKQEWNGTCHSITQDGELNIRLPDKTIHTLSSGEVKKAL